MARRMRLRIRFRPPMIPLSMRHMVVLRRNLTIYTVVMRPLRIHHSVSFSRLVLKHVLRTCMARLVLFVLLVYVVFFFLVFLCSTLSTPPAPPPTLSPPGALIHPLLQPPGLDWFPPLIRGLHAMVPARVTTPFRCYSAIPQRRRQKRRQRAQQRSRREKGLLRVASLPEVSGGHICLRRTPRNPRS